MLRRPARHDNVYYHFRSPGAFPQVVRHSRNVIRCNAGEIAGGLRTLPYIAGSFRHGNDLAMQRQGDAAGRGP